MLTVNDDQTRKAFKASEICMLTLLEPTSMLAVNEDQKLTALLRQAKFEC